MHHRLSSGVTALVSAVSVAALGWIPACTAGSHGGGFTEDDGGSGSSANRDATPSASIDAGTSIGNSSGSLDLSGSSDASSVSTPCPAGLTCDVACQDGGTTSISGKVYDPAGRNPLYNIVVYVPAKPLEPLPKGVPTGADACSCPALYKSGAVAATTTAVDGTFKLTNVPVGSDVPLVVQVGKWRRLFHVGVSSCQDNAQADKTLRLPGTVPAGDTSDSMPDIAVSTGSADTLECLMSRIGLPSTEYVAGAGGSGHVHVFAGGDVDTSGGGGPNGGPGTVESPGMAGAPPSPTSLWASQSQLMPYDIVLLSCEGGETYNANPPALEQYLNAGGRAFASHFHYAWFSGPIDSSQSYSATPDWGTNLATWMGNDADGGPSSGPLGGTIVTTLSGSTQPFAKGQALDQWLEAVGALGQNGVPAGELSIYEPRYNAQVGPTNTPSQPWITWSPWTMYFSFDTPVNAPVAADGTRNYCGRAVFSDLHVGGDPSTTDTPSPPGGCSTGPLSPQEKALEFMLFDLSACVIPDTVAPPTTGIPQ